jgi:hypothetical protein
VENPDIDPDENQTAGKKGLTFSPNGNVPLYGVYVICT